MKLRENILKLAMHYQVKPVSDMNMCYAVIKQIIDCSHKVNCGLR